MKFTGPYAGPMTRLAAVSTSSDNTKSWRQGRRLLCEPSVTQAAFFRALAKLLADFTIKYWSKQLNDFQLKKLSACWWYATCLSHIRHLLGKANASPMKAEKQEAKQANKSGLCEAGLIREVREVLCLISSKWGHCYI